MDDPGSGLLANRNVLPLSLPALLLLMLTAIGAPRAQDAGTPGTVTSPPVVHTPAPDARADSLPFRVGERLEYHIRLGRFGSNGKGSMTVSGPVDVRGTATWLLRFDFSARVGPIKAQDETESWLDPERMTALRFHKRERHPFANGTQDVELFPVEQRWEGADGARGESPTDAPLDELSFIYFIRTLPLEIDSTYTFDRHFEAGRNPVTVRVVGTEVIETKAGTFNTIAVEMRVHDQKHYGTDAGVIRFNFTNDRRRVPVRIESRVPLVGSAVLLLTADTPDE
ncbi:MAG TPA: DUF3108 domain-containing protein [Gemmatimonadaceae bacterium]|nr:DUF3108 domain-containing protein [Gemmatimonadaceae bacterium]